jgi:hypothetical protein
MAGPDRLDSAFRHARVHSIYRGHPDATATGDAPLAAVDARLVEQLQSPAKVATMRKLF